MLYVSIRMEIRRIGATKERDEVSGNQPRARVVENKAPPPLHQVEINIMHCQGISKVRELINPRVEANVVEKSGAWFSPDGQRVGQERENTKRFLRDNPDVAQAIYAKIWAQAGVVAEAMTTAPVTGAADEIEE